MAQDAVDVQKYLKTFCQEALDGGAITAGQIKECLTEMKVARQRGEQLTLFHLLVTKGYLTIEQCDAFSETAWASTLILPGFRVLRRLGKGSMGTVFKARQESLDRLVALKIFARRLPTDTEAVDRFKREARSVGRLSHKNIVSAYDAGENEGRYYLAMQLVDGESADRRLARLGPINETLARSIAWEVAEALEHAHEKQIIHRDIKPSNLMICPDGRVIVTDFGLSRLADNPIITKAGIILGTPQYMAPEQAQAREAVDGRADIYALGATLYHLVSGFPPFDGPNVGAVMAQVLNGEPQSLAQYRTKVGPRFCAFVHQLMSKRKDDRPQTAKEVLAALLELPPLMDESGTQWERLIHIADADTAIVGPASSVVATVPGEVVPVTRAGEAALPEARAPSKDTSSRFFAVLKVFVVFALLLALGGGLLLRAYPKPLPPGSIIEKARTVLSWAMGQGRAQGPVKP